MSIAQLTFRVAQSTHLNHGLQGAHSLPPHTTPSYSLFEEQSHYFNQCPKMDKDFFAARIFTPNDSARNTIANVLVSLIEGDEKISEYINAVFTHLPKFYITTKQNFEVNGAYFPLIKALIVNENQLQIPSRLAQTLRHELKHAFMHAGQLMLGGVDTDAAFVISPTLNHQTKQQLQKELTQKFEIGMARLEKIQKILGGKTKPSVQDRKLIARLNSKISATDREIYPVIYLQKVETKYKLDEPIILLPPNAPIIRGLVKYIEPKDNGQYLILCVETTTREDYLKKLVTNFVNNKNDFYKFKKDVDVFLCEADAHLVGSLPSYVIEEVFPEFNKEISKHTNVVNKALVNQQYSTQYKHLYSLKLIDEIRTNPLASDEFIYEAIAQKINRSDILDKLPKIIERFYNKFETKKCLFLLQALIQHKRADRGDFWAYKMKAAVHVQEKQYALAARTYKIALKKGATLHPQEKEQYSWCLKYIGQIKESKKVLKKV